MRFSHQWLFQFHLSQHPMDTKPQISFPSFNKLFIEKNHWNPTQNSTEIDKSDGGMEWNPEIRWVGGKWLAKVKFPLNCVGEQWNPIIRSISDLMPCNKSSQVFRRKIYLNSNFNQGRLLKESHNQSLNLRDDTQSSIITYFSYYLCKHFHSLLQWKMFSIFHLFWNFFFFLAYHFFHLQIPSYICGLQIRALSLPVLRPRVAIFDWTTTWRSEINAKHLKLVDVIYWVLLILLLLLFYWIVCWLVTTDAVVLSSTIVVGPRTTLSIALWSIGIGIDCYQGRWSKP